MSRKRHRGLRVPLDTYETPSEPEVHGDETAADAAEPEWKGWVYAADGVNGCRRIKLSIPESDLASYAVGKPSGPDIRGNLAQYTLNDTLSDDFMIELSREEQKR